MKGKNHNFFAAGLAAFCVIAASILLFFLLFKIQAIGTAVKQFTQILEPFFVGGVVAYLLAPIYNLLLRNLMEVFSKKLKPRLARGLSVGISLFISILVALLETPPNMGRLETFTLTFGGTNISPPPKTDVTFITTS